MQRRYIDEHVKGAKVSPHRAKLVGGKTRKKNGAVDLNQPPQGPSNVVKYQEKYDFILRRFGATAVQ